MKRSTLVGLLMIFALYVGLAFAAPTYHKQHKLIHARFVEHFNHVVFAENTVFFWNGKACPYDDVPRDAVPFLIELGDDGKTVIKVTFRKVNFRTRD